jgi:serine/threonine protein kinase
MTLSEPTPKPDDFSGDTPVPGGLDAGSAPQGGMSGHDWVSMGDDSLGPELGLPEVTPPYVVDPWPMTPSNEDMPGQALVPELAFTDSGDFGQAYNPSCEGMPDDASITCRPLAPRVRFDTGDAETDDGRMGQDEVTVAGVPANSQRANRQSLEMARRGPQGSSSQVRSFPLRRLIGRGGYGEVWEAIQVSLGRAVAVKHLRPDILRQMRLRQPEVARALEAAFENEALTAAMLEHPNIVPVYDLSTEADGTARLAMKLVRGKNWHDSLQMDFESGQPVAEFLAHHIPILIAISQAVAFAHSRGVVHRDLKPSQVMVGEFGEVLLMDWGIAAVFDPETASLHMPAFSPNQLLRNMEGPAGTPAFMAPEQTQKSQAGVGPWTDIYLLGGILYQLLCGRPPHGASTGKKAFQQACEGVVEPPSVTVAGRREVPHALEDLAMECLSIQPSDRPKSAKQFIRRLEEYLSGADRRREAEEIRIEILRRLPMAGDEYAELARLDALALKARVLSPENRHLADIHELILSRYVHNALDHGDVMLARQQAERIETQTEREDLLAEVARVEERLAGARRQHRAAMIAVAGMTITLLTLGARGTVERIQADRERAQSEFVRASDQISSSFQEALRSHFDDVRTVAAFAAANPRATANQFRIFSESFLDPASPTQTVVFAPIVPFDKRQEFEQSLRLERIPVDGIRERRQNRFEVRAQDREFYVPGRLAGPEDRAEELIGLDYRVLEGVGTAINWAMNTAKPAASEPVAFPDPSPLSVAVVVPVLSEGRTVPDGFAIGFWNVQLILERTLAAAAGRELSAEVTDARAQLAGGDGVVASVISKDLADRTVDRQVSRYPINLAGRRWMLEIMAPLHASDHQARLRLFQEFIWPVAAVLIVLFGVLISRLRFRSLLKRV